MASTPPGFAARNCSASGPGGSKFGATLSTRADSISRALDEVGEKWCLLTIQEAFRGINTFSGMLEAYNVRIILN